MTLASRFEEKYIRQATDECWPWIAAKNKDGYGEIKAESGNKKYKAHRVAFALANGYLTDGRMQVVDHICKNTSCVNPAHLRAISRIENTMIGNGFYAVNARKTHCINGHEFTPWNTVKHSGGGRRCLTCKRIKHQEYKRRKRRS